MANTFTQARLTLPADQALTEIVSLIIDKTRAKIISFMSVHRVGISG